MNKNFIFYFLLLIIVPLPLFGYLDPGSGSMLFSAVIGIVATLFFVIKGVFFKIIDLPAYFSGVSRGKRAKHSIVFYCEGPQYWNIFLPVIKELSSRNVKCTYLSSKENDPGLSCGFPNVETKFIGEGNKAFFYLNTLSADVCIMTTPGLDVLQIKRSKGVKKYIHITHSSGGCSGYSTFGLDYYDIVLTGGEGDKEFINKIEEVRGLNKKIVEPVGCTYLDIMRDRLNELENCKNDSNGRKTILISPTWGSHGLLNKYGERLLKIITGSGKYSIIVRPHPQSFVSEKKIVDELMERYQDNEFLKWDREPDGLNSMKRADIMVSDFSGIVFDFIFLFKKPVITFKDHYDRKGKDSMDYPGIPWNIKVLDIAGKSLNDKDIEKIDEIIEDVAGAGISEDVFNTLKDGMDKYPMESGKRAADVILKTVSGGI
ncbi:CDP-glycerol glycerophosphotransferase family protein [bacterium]|nr:CDP-glycerol glycerophosphotransferase family protein [bacterium]